MTKFIKRNLVIGAYIIILRTNTNIRVIDKRLSQIRVLNTGIILGSIDCDND